MINDITDDGNDKFELELDVTSIQMNEDDGCDIKFKLITVIINDVIE